MAGKIIADTLETGAGADIATSYVVNGSAKAWIRFNGQNTVSIVNSLNCSTLTDVGTGQYTIAYVSNMQSNGNSVQYTNNAESYSFTTGSDRQFTMVRTNTTFEFDLQCINDGATLNDSSQNNGTVHGDLA